MIKYLYCFSRSRFRRAKDLYDTWLIVNNCKPNLDMVSRILTAKGIYPLPLDKAPFRDDCILEMQHAYEKFRLIDPITEQEINKPDFFEIVKVVGNFLVKFMRDDT